MVKRARPQVEKALKETLKAMEKKPAGKKEKISFSKFFPEDYAFIKLDGQNDPKDPYGFNIDLTIQTGLQHYACISSWFGVDDKDTKTAVNQLTAIRDAADKALKFIEDAKKSVASVEKDIKAKRVTKTK